ncbi:MAG: DMT family transporter [Planctomycetota bacterium]
MAVWLWLLAAICGEVAFATCTKLSLGWTRPLPTIAVFLVVPPTMYCLAQAMRGLPLGTAYAIWSGLTLCSLTLIGALISGDRLGPDRLVWVALLIVAVVGLHRTQPV